MQHLKSLCINAYFILLCFSIFINEYTANAQRQALVDIQHSSTIDNVTREQIEKISIGKNVNEILKFTPGTHHLESRETVFDYDDPNVDKTTQEIFYNGMNMPQYLQSVTVNTSGVPIKAIEQVYNGKNLLQGYKWENYNGIQSAKLYSNETKNYDPYTFQPTWKPMFNYNPIDLSTIKPMDKNEWDIQVKNIFSKGTYNETTANDLYGGNSETIYMPVSSMEVVEKKYYDSRHTLRKYVYKEYYSDDWEYEEITYYDCDGKKTYFESTLYDDYDYEVETVDIKYKQGEPVAYWRDVDDYDADFREFFNPSTGNFEYINKKNYDYADYVWNAAKEEEPCDDFPYNYIFLGGSLISEDNSYQRFNTIGVEVSYTRIVCPSHRLGLTLDAGLTSGSQFNVDYSKLNVLGGVTYIPFKRMGLNNKFTFSLDALAGIASVTAKSGSYKSTGTNLAGELGAKASYNLTHHFGIAAGAAINPVFARGNTSTNYRLFAGVRLGF